MYCRGNSQQQYPKVSLLWLDEEKKAEIEKHKQSVVRQSVKVRETSLVLIQKRQFFDGH